MSSVVLPNHTWSAKGVFPHDVILNRNCWLAALCVYFPLICECSVYECFVYECFVYECACGFRSRFMVSWIHRYSLTWFMSASKHLVSKVCGYVWPGYPKSSTSASKHLLSCVWLQEIGHVPAVTLEFTETSECVVNRSVLSERGTAMIYISRTHPIDSIRMRWRSINR